MSRFPHVTAIRLVALLALPAFSIASADLIIANVTGSVSGAGSNAFVYRDGTPASLGNAFFPQDWFSFSSPSTNTIRIENISGGRFEFSTSEVNVALTGVANNGGLDFQSIAVTPTGVVLSPAITLSNPNTLSIAFQGSDFSTGGTVDVAFSTAAVPEPSAFLLSVIVSFPFLARRRRRILEVKN